MLDIGTRPRDVRDGPLYVSVWQIDRQTLEVWKGVAMRVVSFYFHLLATFNFIGHALLASPFKIPSQVHTHTHTHTHTKVDLKRNKSLCCRVKGTSVVPFHFSVSKGDQNICPVQVKYYTSFRNSFDRLPLHVRA